MRETLHIGIDASRAFRAQRTGTERYSLEIVRHLLALPEAANYQWKLYTDVRPNSHLVDNDTPNEFGWLSDCAKFAEVVHIPGYPMWTHRVLSKALRRHRPDVTFIPAHVVPFRFGMSAIPGTTNGRYLPTVVTIHDIGYRYFPESHGLLHRSYLELSTRWSTYAANQTIAVSQSTADDLGKFYGVPESKVTVIHEGPPTLASVNAASTANVRRFGLERPYGIFVGTLQPRKNLVRLLKAYAKLYEQQRPEWDLVLVGAKGWLSNEIEDLAERLSGAVHMLGYVDDALLPALISGAQFFCLPSLFEGFGLPVLEAQHYGIPVMTSNNSSLPEVAGDAAILVDPLNIDEIADAMLRLSEDEALRQRLIAAGHENVKRFSWERAARETLAVLEKAAGMSR